MSTSLAATTKVFNDVVVPGQDQRENERGFYTATPGHNKFLINHETVKMAETIVAPGGLNALQTNLSHNLRGDTFTTDGAPGRLDLWHIQPIGDVDVPYWDVKVDPAIIKDHGDILNPKAQAMMAAIFRMTNPLINHGNNIKRRAVLKKEPARPKVAPEPDQSRPRPGPRVKNDTSAKPTPKPRAESPFERTR